MGFADQLLTGYKIGSGIRGKYDERKKQAGMKDAVSAVKDPRMQTQQEQMLEQQTMGEDSDFNEDQNWRPTSADWSNMRLKGAEKIMETGGSLEDVERFQSYVDNKQKQGIQKYSNMAADALDRGDIDAAARYLDVGYGYLDDGVLLQSSNVNGQLMSFAKDEATGDMIEVPVPFRSGDDIRRMAQAHTDNNAFLNYSWGRHKFEKEFGLKESADERAENADQRAAAAEGRAQERHPLDMRKAEVEIAEKEGKMQTDEYGVTTGSTGGARGIAGAAGWSNTELNAAHDDFRTTMNRFDPNDPNYVDTPANKLDLYGDYNNPNPKGFQTVQQHGIGLMDVNPGIQAQTAHGAAEKLARLTMASPEAYAKYMDRNAKEDVNSPTGYSVNIDGRNFNLPVHLAPDGGAFAREYQKYYASQTAGGKRYKKKDRPGLPEWYRKKHGIEETNTRSASPAAVGAGQPPARAVQPPASPVRQQQGVPAQSPSPAGAQAVRPPAPGLNATGYTKPGQTYIGDLEAPSGGGAGTGGGPGGGITSQVTAMVGDEIARTIDPRTGKASMDRETARELLDQLRGFKSQEADVLRDVLKEIISGKRR